MKAVETTGLTKVYPSQKALGGVAVTAADGISLSVEEGETFGLIGPNGAGKTTLINMLCTLATPTSGRALVSGIDAEKDPSLVKRLIGLVTSNERSFYWRLTGRENLLFFAALYRIPPKEASRRIDELIAGLDLAGFAHRRFDGYSTGIRQRFAFARALIHRPRILFMDEPTKGLDPLAAMNLTQFIKERIRGVWNPTIIITSHNLSEIEILCGRIGIMERARLIYQGDIEELRSIVYAHETYRLTVSGPLNGLLASIGAVDGVLGAELAGDAAGSSVIEIRMDSAKGTVKRVLEAVLGSGCAVEGFTSVSASFKDVVMKYMAQERRGAL